MQWTGQLKERTRGRNNSMISITSIHHSATGNSLQFSRRSRAGLHHHRRPDHHRIENERRPSADWSALARAFERCSTWALTYNVHELQSPPLQHFLLRLPTLFFFFFIQLKPSQSWINVRSRPITITRPATHQLRQSTLITFTIFFFKFIIIISLIFNVIIVDLTFDKLVSSIVAIKFDCIKRNELKKEKKRKEKKRKEKK